MAENRYWFARRFPVGSPRNGMSPVTPEGYRVAWTFVAFMVGGAIAALALLALGYGAFTAWGLSPATWLLGALAPVVFIGCAIYGAWYFLAQTRDRGDQQHTIADYKAGRVKPE